MTDSSAGSLQDSDSKLSEKNALRTGLVTAAVVGVGAALIEVEWVPGLLLGVAAMAFPKLVPGIGRGVRPFVRSAIKAGYTATHKTREWMAEAGEQMSDMVAEVRAASMDETSAAGARVQAASTASSKAATNPANLDEA